MIVGWKFWRFCVHAFFFFCIVGWKFWRFCVHAFFFFVLLKKIKSKRFSTVLFSTVIRNKSICKLWRCMRAVGNMRFQKKKKILNQCAYIFSWMWSSALLHFSIRTGVVLTNTWNQFFLWFLFVVRLAFFWQRACECVPFRFSLFKKPGGKGDPSPIDFQSHFFHPDWRGVDKHLEPIFLSILSPFFYPFRRGVDKHLEPIFLNIDFQSHFFPPCTGVVLTNTWKKRKFVLAFYLLYFVCGNVYIHVLYRKQVHATRLWVENSGKLQGYGLRILSFCSAMNTWSPSAMALIELEIFFHERCRLCLTVIMYLWYLNLLRFQFFYIF